MIRRLKKDVLTQLPPKQRQKIPFELKDSKIKSVRQFYAKVLLRVIEQNVR